MKRRAFLAGLAVAAMPLAISAPRALPQMETTWFPPHEPDPSDPLGTAGYCSAKCTVNGKVYGITVKHYPSKFYTLDGDRYGYYRYGPTISEADARDHAAALLLRTLRTARVL